MQPHLLPTEDIAGIYRFATLLAGAPAAAQSVILETFADAREKIHHFRDGKSCKAWLIAKLRNRFMNRPAPTAQERVAVADPETLQPECSSAAIDLSARFSKLPEPGRSGLALIYINQFSTQEIAQILQISVDELCAAVGTARDQLRAGESAATGAGEGIAP